MKKTIALTLLGLASTFALTTTSVQAEELSSASTKTNINVAGGGIKFSTGKPTVGFEEFTIDGQTDNKILEASEAISLNVNDLRGTHEGWNVSANITDLSYTNGEVTDTIDGASIVLKNGGLSDSFGDVIKIANSLEIKDAGTPISNAEAGTGMGNWDHSWAAEDITLNIPAKAARDMYEGSYSTTITWTLSATPQDETASSQAE